MHLSEENSNKMLYIRRDHIYSLRSKRFLSLIKAVKNLEKNFGSDELDIEFAVDKNRDESLQRNRFAALVVSTYPILGW